MPYLGSFAVPLSVPFGVLPIGTVFQIREVVHHRGQPTFRTRTLIKATHGTLAGFADNDQRFNHSSHVVVDGSDLRLAVAIARSPWMKGQIL